MKFSFVNLISLGGVDMLRSIKYYILNYFLSKKYNSLIEKSAKINKLCVFEGKNRICNGTSVENSKIGYSSYVGSNSTIINANIGRFTSIGPNVSIIIGQHPTRTFVSTHPVFFSMEKQIGYTYVSSQLFDEFKYSDEECKYSVVIGNDVWIGNGAKIMEGITIGDGAIIAAGAIVTKNVLAYAIVGGVPAKIIKYRFQNDEIEYLLKIKWWDKDEKWIRDNAKYFYDIKYFMKITGTK